jgi:hypothetical protein
VIEAFDNVLADAAEYRAKALAGNFESVTLGDITFHGIAVPPDSSFAAWFVEQFPDYEPTLTFLRKSPLGQVEPNLVHNDCEMGDVTAILYLNPNPPTEDGTAFYQSLASGEMEGEPLSGDAGKDMRDWKEWTRVGAKFNRCAVFSAPLYHARSLAMNYGTGDEARLIQVLFARKRAA